MARQKRPGAGPSSRITRREVLLAAYRHYELGDTQASIAHEMEISPSYLAKLLRHAKEQGWIRVFIDTDREIELAARIKAKYPHLKHVEVVPTGDKPEATAKAVATAMASWFNDLLDEDEEREEPRIKNVAIGGAWPHRLMVDQVVPRPNRISVGPTTLTPFRGRVARWTASTVATQLAERLGALAAGDAAAPEKTRQGYFYNLSVDPPRNSMSALRDWYAMLEEREDYQEMQRFWQSCDVVFASVVGVDYLYNDVKQRLLDLGTSLEEMKEKGAIAVIANQFMDANGQLVSLSDGVPSYEPAMSLDLLSSGGSGEVRPIVALDTWGPPATPIGGLAARLGRVLFTDSVGGSH